MIKIFEKLQRNYINYKYSRVWVIIKKPLVSSKSNGQETQIDRRYGVYENLIQLNCNCANRIIQVFEQIQHLVSFT